MPVIVLAQFQPTPAATTGRNLPYLSDAPVYNALFQPAPATLAGATGTNIQIGGTGWQFEPTLAAVAGATAV